MEERKSRRHAQSDQVEFAACGLAYDAFESGDHYEPVVMAGSPQLVTCSDCVAVIEHYRNQFKQTGRGWRQL